MGQTDVVMDSALTVGRVQLDRTGVVRAADVRATEILGKTEQALRGSALDLSLDLRALKPGVFHHIPKRNHIFLVRKMLDAHQVQLLTAPKNMNVEEPPDMDIESWMAVRGVQSMNPETRPHWDQSPQAMPIFRFRSGQIIDANRATLRMTGQTRDSLRGQTSRDISPPEWLHKTDRLAAQLIRYARAHETWSLRTPSGACPIELRVVLFQVGNRTYGINLWESCNTHVDTVTEAPITINTRDLVTETDRFVLLGQLARGVAHEVSTPATWVRGNLSLLEDQLSGQPAAKQLIRECADGLEQIGQLMESLRVFGDSKLNNREPIFIDVLMQEAVRVTRMHVESKADLAISLSARQQVSGNRGRLLQVVVALIRNSVESFPVVDPSNRIRLVTRDVDEQVLIQISDTGPGIAAELQRRVFEPFFTTRPVGSNAGLGLPSALKIVRQHGGSLALHSNEAGTLVEVRLPAAKVTYQLKPQARSDDWTPGSCGGRVLLVDDDPMLCRVFSRVLRPFADVSVAIGGEEAIRVLQEDQEWDLVICDLMMPEVDGVDIHRWLRLHAPGLANRLTFLSGGAYSERTQAFLGQHKLVPISKPIAPNTLIRYVKRHVQPTPQ